MALLQDIEDFLAKHPEVSATALGDKALGDRHFVRQLRRGRRTWEETETKVRGWMSAYPALASVELRAHGADSAINDDMPEARQIICDVCDVRVDQGWPACPNADCPRPAAPAQVAAEPADVDFPPADVRQAKAA